MKRADEQKTGVVHVEVEATARVVTLVRVELPLGQHGVDKDEAERVAREKLKEPWNFSWTVEDKTELSDLKVRYRYGGD